LTQSASRPRRGESPLRPPARLNRAAAPGNSSQGGKPPWVGAPGSAASRVRAPTAAGTWHASLTRPAVGTWGQRFGLQARLFAAVALLLGAATVTPIFFLPQRLEVQNRRAVEQRAADVARAFAGALETALDFGDRQRALEVLRGLATTTGAAYGRLLTEDGSTLATWGSVPGRPPPFPRGGAEAILHDDGLLHVRVPVATPAGLRGALHVGMGLAELEERRREARALVGFTAVVTFAAGLAAAFALGTVLTGPLRRMSALTSRISRGDEVAPHDLAVKGGEEVGAVASAFGTVLDRLTEQRALLESQSEASSEAILTLGGTGAVLTYNRRFRELWGISAERMAGASWSDLRNPIAGALAEPLPAWLDCGAPVPPGPTAEAFDLCLLDGRSGRRARRGDHPDRLLDRERLPARGVGGAARPDAARRPHLVPPRDLRGEAHAQAGGGLASGSRRNAQGRLLRGLPRALGHGGLLRRHHRLRAQPRPAPRDGPLVRSGLRAPPPSGRLGLRRRVRQRLPPAHRRRDRPGLGAPRLDRPQRLPAAGPERSGAGRPRGRGRGAAARGGELGRSRAASDQGAVFDSALLSIAEPAVPPVAE